MKPSPTKIATNSWSAEGRVYRGQMSANLTLLHLKGTNWTLEEQYMVENKRISPEDQRKGRKRHYANNIISFSFCFLVGGIGMTLIVSFSLTSSLAVEDPCCHFCLNNIIYFNPKWRGQKLNRNLQHTLKGAA